MGLSIISHAVLYLKYDDLEDVLDHKLSYDRINDILKGLGYPEIVREDWMEDDFFLSANWNTSILDKDYEICTSNLKYASGWDSIDTDNNSIAFYINFYQSEVKLNTLLEAGNYLEALNKRIQILHPSQAYSICFRTTML